MQKILMLVGAGGLLGSVGRYLMGHYIYKMLPVMFPYGTLSINILGCFFIGMVMSFSNKQAINPEWRLFLATGFCGGFTTFSTFAFENLNLLIQKEYFYFFLYAFASYALGLTAVCIGLLLFKQYLGKIRQ